MWLLEHAVEANVSRAFAWQFRTCVANWHDPPATFVLDGPFAEGARGRTLMPGQEPRHWRIVTVRPERSFVVEMPLDGAILSFEWSFDVVTEDWTRLTQRIGLDGDNANAYTEQVLSAFGATLAAGMERIASEIAAARIV